MASILTNLGVGYEYEKPLHSKKDEKDFRLPGFTTKYEEEEYYWDIFACLKVPSTKESPRALSIFERL